jgi:hypothetical protein
MKTESLTLHSVVVNAVEQHYKFMKGVLGFFFFFFTGMGDRMAVGLHQHRRGVATLNQRVTKSRRPMMGINTKSQWPWCGCFVWEINGQLVHVGVYDNVPCVAISCWHLSFHGLVKCGGKTLEDETLPKLSSACERIKDWGIWTHLRKAT